MTSPCRVPPTASAVRIGACLVSLVLLAAAAPSLTAQTTSPAGRLAGFDAYTAKAVSDWHVPGLAVAIVKDGEQIFAKGYGQRELGKPESVDTRTLFAVGSTTKAMTAAAVGLLVDEGKLKWDDRVIDHLPSFRLYDPYVTREVTVRDLLTHRAGLPNADYLWYGANNSPDEIIRRLRLVEPESSLRSHFTYQNIMYAAAGALIGAVSGQPWDRFLQARIFTPLGMRSTLPTAATLAQQTNVASPHFTVDGTVRVIANASVDRVAAAGAVWSNVEDMSRWLRFLLNDCTIADAARTAGRNAASHNAAGRNGAHPDSHGQRLLKPETCAELFRPQTMVGPDGFYPTAKLTKPHWTTYGLGWFQQDYAGRALDYHTGSIDGMVAIAGLVRDERLDIVVLANLDHAELRHALMYRLFDAFGPSTSPPPRDWSAELRTLYDELANEGRAARAKVEAARVANTKPSLAVDRYAGRYTHPLYGRVDVTLEGGTLRVTYGPGFDGTLSHWHYDTFQVRWAAAWYEPSLVTFTLDASGSPATVDVNGLRFPRAK